jgi:4-amino-4-deoxy-L-arabinose transferase-like glycosyltransferase
MLALGMLTLFAIAIQLGGRMTAYLATLLYTLSPALLLNGRRAMTEGTMTLFSLLVILAGMYAVQTRKWWAFVLLGLCGGLAVASKHTSVVTVAAIFLGYSIVLVYRIFQEKSHAPADTLHRLPTSQFVYLTVAGVLSVIVFYALNPVWWSNPVARASEVAEIRLNFMQAQHDTFGGYNSFTDRLDGFFWQTFGNEIIYAETPVDNFVENLADEIAAYETSPFSGFINHHNIAIPVTFMGLSAIGAIALWFDKFAQAEMRFVVGVWIAAMIILTLCLTPLEWQRYYLPAYPAVMLLTGLGIRFVLIHIRH